ncbi:MAG: hypothetical protein HZA77_03040 [Candidatus Schekmanbacteria bacterium]|nr:hypothetical protein [Candidatus Schekmanbacteria bacterium]
MKSKKKELKNCPFCGEKADSDARACPSCGRIFKLNGMDSNKKDNSRGKYLFWAMSLFAVLLLILGAVFLPGGNGKRLIAQNYADDTATEVQGEENGESTDQQGEDNAEEPGSTEDENAPALTEPGSNDEAPVAEPDSGETEPQNETAPDESEDE